jgi:hypothetical protein
MKLTIVWITTNGKIYTPVGFPDPKDAAEYARKWTSTRIYIDKYDDITHNPSARVQKTLAETTDNIKGETGEEEKIENPNLDQAKGHS